MPDSPKKWLKQHKKEIIANLIKESGAIPDNELSALFMAGLPGAGKTEVSKNFIDIFSLKTVRIDMDEIASKIEGYRPEIADQFRKPASTLLSEILSTVLKDRLDFVMDGTFGSPYALKNVERTLHHGYSIRIVYVHQDPKIAWNFTRAREKVEHRAIGIEDFIDSYFNTINNIRKVLNKNYANVSLEVVLKNAKNQIGKWSTDIGLSEFDKITTNNYNKRTLRKYIEC